MKVKLIGYDTLKAHLDMEGDSIVEKDEDLFLDENIEGEIPFVAAKALGFVFEEGKEFFMVTRRFNSKWNRQNYVSFPLPTILNDNLGYSVESGRVGRYVQDNPYEELFENLSPLLNEMKYKGFISLKFNSNKKLLSISFGAGLALYNILEGVKGKLSDFFFNEEEVMESWSISLVLSRYPYPFRQTSDRIFISIPPSAGKHLWFYNMNSFRKTSYTDQTKICIVTSWALSVNEAARRVYRTCKGLDILLKQYRTDVVNVGTKLWGEFVA